MEFFTENPSKNIRLPLKLEEGFLCSQNCDMLKIFFAEAGNSVLYMNGRKVEICAPTVVCLDAAENFTVAENEGLHAKLLYFSPSMVNAAFDIKNIREDIKTLSETVRLDHYYFKPFIERDRREAAVIKPGGPAAGRIAAIFEALGTQLCSYEDNYWPCKNRSYLIELLFTIQNCYFEGKDPNAGKAPDRSGIEDIILFINFNYSTKVTIDGLSRQFHTNRNSLNKKFKHASGQSIMAYLIKARIDAACRLLRDTSLPVAEIAERVGFSDPSYWGRAFRRQTGLTPSGYRKLARADGVVI